MGKTAGTSIHVFLEHKIPERLWCPLGRRFQLGTHRPWDLDCPDRPNDLLCFGVVRDPRKHIRSLHRQYYDRAKVARSRKHPVQMMDVPEGDEPHNINEWIQQELFAFTKPEQMLADCDFVLRFETLAEDWTRFCSFAHIRHKALPHRNNPKAKVSEDELSQTTVKILNQHYDWVFEHYDYPRF